MGVSVRIFYNALTNESSEKKPAKTLAFSRWTPYLVIIGCFIDILSTFLPWGTDFGKQLFLPFSIPLPLDWSVRFIPGTFLTLLISVATRLAAILGFAALLLYGYCRNILPTLVLLVSIGLSFSCFTIFSQFGWSLSSGAYIVLFAGFLKLVGLILRNLYVETAEEPDNAKPDPYVQKRVFAV